MVVNISIIYGCNFMYDREGDFQSIIGEWSQISRLFKSAWYSKSFTESSMNLVVKMRVK